VLVYVLLSRLSCHVVPFFGARTYALSSVKLAQLVATG
jgi:hypothetical protein